MLEDLKSADESRQIVALTDLSEYLSFSTEELLLCFPVESAGILAGTERTDDLVTIDQIFNVCHNFLLALNQQAEIDLDCGGWGR